MREWLCWLGFHRWVDYEFDFSMWWTGKGVIVYCGCGASKSIKTVQGLRVVRGIVNREY